MATQFKLTTVVVLGAWNPSILTPDWLSKYKIIDSSPKEPPSLNLELAAHRLTFSVGGLNWSVDHTRLELRVNELRDVGQYAARILGLLSHTPVRSIGTNFVFLCPAGEWSKECSWQLSGVPLNISGAKQVQWSITRTDNSGTSSETRVRITLTRLSNGDVNIGFNFHRSTGSAEDAVRFASEWQRDKDMAVAMLKSELKIECAI